MTIHTPLCAMLGIRHPLLLAPMANVAGGRLAAAVTAGGGLGLIGGGYCDPEWLAREFAAADGAAVGVGFITWRLAAVPGVLEFALAQRPRAVWLSFGDCRPFIEPIKAAGCRVLVQVQSVAQAREARAAGADIIIAQGSEAGGHAGQRATLPLVPAVVDAVQPLPVVAAGGIADGRGVAAALMLGAAGVALGSRFYVAPEALAHPHARAAVLAASGDATVRSAVFDLVRGWDWPPGYALRTLANDLTAAWQDDQAGVLRRLGELRSSFADAVVQGDARLAPVIVGEAIDLVDEPLDAATLVARLMADAARVIGGAQQLLRERAPPAG